VDAGVVLGQTIGVHYDPLLSKVIAHGETREQARERLIAALRWYEILGLHHNIAFLLRLLDRPEFRDSTMHTRFIESAMAELAAPPAADLTQAAAAIAAFAASRDAEPAMIVADSEAARDPWDLIGRVAW
jgi:acetyl/propionyl-CoA carboxylase alpha subunit